MRIRERKRRMTMFQFVVMICVMVVPVLAAMLASNLYAIGVVKSQVAITNRNMTMLSMGQLGERLISVALHMASPGVTNEEGRKLGREETEYERTL